MTKKFKIYTIGMICSIGIFCSLIKKSQVISNSKKVCRGNHHFEIAQKDINYTQTFDTIRPEMYVGDIK